MIELDRVKRARTVGALVMVLCIAVPALAQGQTPDAERAAAANALYEKATAEMDAGNYQTACPMLEEVTKIAPEGLGAKLTLAECYEAAGKLASAWSLYTLVEELALKAKQADRSKKAAKKAAAIKPRLATLSIELPDDVRSIPGLSITRDGVQLEDAQWGLPLPVDAGAHEVTATAPGRKAWKYSTEALANGGKLVVQVKPLEVEVKESLPGPTPVVPAKPPAPRQQLWQTPLGIGAMALGGAGVAVGALLGGLALSKNGASNEENHCDVLNRCDDVGLSLRKDAVGLGNGSTVAIVVGAVVLAGGVVLFATAPKAAPKDERAAAGSGRWSAAVELLPGGLRVKGSW